MTARTPATPAVPFFLSPSITAAVEEINNQDAADAAQLTQLAQNRAFLVKQINDLDAMALEIATNRQARGLANTPAPAPLPAAPVLAATPAPAPAAASTPVTPTPAPAPAGVAPAVPVTPVPTAPTTPLPAASPAASATPATAEANLTPRRGVINWIKNNGGALIGLGIAVLISFVLLVVVLWITSQAAEVFGILITIWVLVTLILGGVGLFLGARKQHPKTHIEPSTPSE